MNRRNFLTGSALMFLFGCSSEDEEDEKKCNDPAGCDGELPRVTSELQGKAEKGPYRKDSEVSATPYNLSWNQSGFPVEGYTEQNDGSYEVQGDVSSEFVRMKIEGESYNEVDNVYDNVSLRDMSRNDGTVKNLNPLTTIQDMIAFRYCKDENHQYFGQGDNCLALAKSEILNFLQFSDEGKLFNKLSLQGNSLSDAQMAVFSFYIAGGRSGPEQNDHLRTIANGILDNNLTLKQQIQDYFNSVEIKVPRDNLKAKYSELGLGAICPPVELLPFIPSYYNDIWNNGVSELESKNNPYSASVSIDATYQYFAYPVEFTENNPKYFALNLQPGLSIYDVRTHSGGYLCPGNKIADLSVLREVLLDLSYNYQVNVSIPSGQYFIVQEFEGRPSKLSEGDLVPFGKNLASHDGVDWVGFDNPTGWFTRSIKFVSYS